VFDYNYYCWTYPYAQWYNPDYGKSPKKGEHLHEEEPVKEPVEMKTMETQVDLRVPPVMMVEEIQTEKEVTVDQRDMETEYDPPKQDMSYLKIRDEAARKIQAQVRARGKRAAIKDRERQF